MPSLQTHDDLALQAATEDHINDTRDRLEQSPVMAMGYLVDSDLISEMRMSSALDVFEAIAPGGQLTWRMADNTSVDLTKVQLQDLLTDMRYERALRGNTLHTIATTFKTALENGQTLTLRDIAEENWI